MVEFEYLVSGVYPRENKTIPHVSQSTYGTNADSMGPAVLYYLYNVVLLGTKTVKEQSMLTIFLWQLREV